MKYAALAFLLALPLFAQLPPPPSMALDTRVPVPPAPVAGDGKLHLGYELHLTNFRGADLALTKLEILGDGAVLQTITDFAPVLSRPGMKPGGEKHVLAGGSRAIAFLWPIVDKAPKTLRHRITYTLGGSEATVTTPEIAVSTLAPAVLAPPLRGERWIASYGPSNEAPHRRTVLPLEGAARIPQRFATDWVRAGADGKAFHGDPSKNENWGAYGAEVYAVADGTIVATVDGIPDNTPPNLPPGGTIDQAGGNHVILDLGDGRYAFFAHLKPGSLRVHKGDRVKRGQVLGLVGNSGNSMGPHLHFHVSTDPTPLATEGLPYVLTSFVEMGRVASSEGFEGGEAWVPKPGFPGVRHTKEMVMGDMVVTLE